MIVLSYDRILLGTIPRKDVQGDSLTVDSAIGRLVFPVRFSYFAGDAEPRLVLVAESLETATHLRGFVPAVRVDAIEQTPKREEDPP